MDPNDLTNVLVMSFKIHTRIIELQDRLIGILESSPEELQLVESLKTLIDELKAVLK